MRTDDWFVKFAQRKLESCGSTLLVDLEIGTCTLCEPGEMRFSDNQPKYTTYADWLRVFVETEVMPADQAKVQLMFSPDNLKQVMSFSSSHVSVTFANREGVWMKVIATLIDADSMGFAKSVMLEKIEVQANAMLAENRYFHSGLFGVIQFESPVGGTNRWPVSGVLKANEEALRTLDYTPEEFYRKASEQDLEIIAPCDIVNFREALGRLDRIGSRTMFSVKLLNRQGLMVAVRGELELCCNDDGKRFVQALFIDDTSNEKTGAVISDLKKELSDLSEASPCAMHRGLMAGASRIEQVNREFTLLTGYDAVDLRELPSGGTLQGIMAGPEDVAAFNQGFSKALTSGQRVMVEFKIKRKSGRVVSVKDWLYVSHDDRDRLWLYGSMIENSDEKRAVAKAAQLEAKAENHIECASLITELANSIKVGRGDQIKIYKALETLSSRTGASVVVYGLNEQEDAINVEINIDGRNAPKEPFGEIRTDMFEKWEFTGANLAVRVYSTPMLLKPYLKSEIYNRFVDIGIERLVLIPLCESQDTEPRRWIYMFNPDAWFIEEGTARQVAAVLSLIN